MPVLIALLTAALAAAGEPSRQQEMRLHLERNNRFIETADVQAYLHQVARRLAVRCGRNAEFQVRVTLRKDHEAVGLAGGYLYLNAGLIALAANEAEAAAVLAFLMAGSDRPEWTTFTGDWPPLGLVMGNPNPAVPIGALDRKAEACLAASGYPAAALHSILERQMWASGSVPIERLRKLRAAQVMKDAPGTTQTGKPEFDRVRGSIEQALTNR